MIPLRDLFETHLTVTDLRRSLTFYGQTLGLELAEVFWERRVAFYWIGGRGNSMLGLWEVGTGPQKLSLHLAFRTDLKDLLEAPARLRAAKIVPLDFDGQPTGEPVVLAWMPAASLYSAILTAICWNCLRCCRMTRKLNWGLFVGAVGRKAGRAEGCPTALPEQQALLHDRDLHRIRCDAPSGDLQRHRSRTRQRCR
jgi:lactoylglutathione lyase